MDASSFLLQLAHAFFGQRNDSDATAEALDVCKQSDMSLYIKQFVRPKAARIQKWYKRRDEVAAVRSQFGTLLHEDVFTVLKQFLHPNCAIEEELEAMAITTVADGCEAQWLFRATELDTMCQTAAYFTNAVKFFLVGSEHWTAYVLRCRIGQPSVAALLVAAKAPIPADVGDDFFAKQSTDTISNPLCDCIRADARHNGMAVLRTVKSRMDPRDFESQLCDAIDDIAIHVAIRSFAYYKKRLDFDYLRLLVPSDLSATHFDEDSFVRSLKEETAKEYENAHMYTRKKSIRIIEELTECVKHNTNVRIPRRPSRWRTDEENDP